MSLSRKYGLVKPFIHMPQWFSWVVIFEAIFGCHDVLILGISSIKLRQLPDMTIAIDWDAKHHFKQTKKLWSKRKLPYEPQRTEQDTRRVLPQPTYINNISRHASNGIFIPDLHMNMYFLQKFK